MLTDLRDGFYFVRWKEFDAGFTLECPNLLGERRLGDAESLGGLSEVQFRRQKQTCISSDAIPFSAFMAASTHGWRRPRPCLFELSEKARCSLPFDRRKLPMVTLGALISFPEKQNSFAVEFCWPRKA